MHGENENFEEPIKIGGGSSNIEPQATETPEEIEEVTVEETVEEVTEETVEEPTEDTVEETVEDVEETTETEETDDTVEETDDEAETDEADDTDDSAEFEEKFTKTFELSHSDIRSGLYALLVEFEELDNEWYWIEEVYENRFVYSSFDGEKIWCQGYTKNDADNTVKYEGERTELFRELLTASEKAELESMRANYSELKSFKETYDLTVSREEKKVILANECYSSIAEMDEFKELCKDESLDKYSNEEIEKEANALLGKFTAQNFALNSNVEEKEPVKKNVATVLFAAQKHESSFLDGLLAMGKASR